MNSHPTSFLLAGLLVIFTGSLSAQLPYVFEVDSADYIDLVGSTPLDDPGWDDPEFLVNLGFDFPFFGQMISELYQGGLGSMMATPGENMGYNVLVPGLYDLADLPASQKDYSQISWLTEGTSGDHIFKIEWQNCGFYEEVFEGDSLAPSRYNGQVWLYEATGTIEYRYGLIDVQFEPESPFVTVGLARNVNESVGEGELYLLTGPESAPTLVQTILELAGTSGVTSDPSWGRIYRFTPEVDAVDEAAAATLAQLSVYPNPATGPVQINLGPQATFWRAVDMAGRTIAEGKAQGWTTVDLSGAAAGQYLLHAEGFAPTPLVIR